MVLFRSVTNAAVCAKFHGPGGAIDCKYPPFAVLQVWLDLPK